VKSRCFLIADIDTKMIVEETTRKDIIGYIEEYLENIEYGNDMSDYAFRILYKDGSTDEVFGNDYNGHKIKRINILSIVVDNPCTSITYGNYRINQYGVVNPSSEMEIDNNIIEVTNYE
jgi:hypothetical protein